MAWLPQRIPSRATGVAGFRKKRRTADVFRAELLGSTVRERRRNLGMMDDHKEGCAIRGIEEERRCSVAPVEVILKRMWPK